MRKLTARQSRPEARLIRDALQGGEVPASVKTATGDDGATTWDVWVHDDEDLERANELLAAYEANPDDERIQELARRGPEKRRKTEREQKQYAKRVERAQRDLRRAQTPGVPVITVGTIMLSAGVAVITGSGAHGLAVLRFVPDAVLAGEIWRPFTAVVMHMGLIHLIFNCYWMWVLGRDIEQFRPSRYLFAQLVLFGVGGVLAQWWIGGSSAVGLSGAIYGLAGFRWMHGRLSPASPLSVEPSIVALLVVFMGIGFLAPMFGWANWAHAGGFFLGLCWGSISGAAEARR